MTARFYLGTHRPYWLWSPRFRQFETVPLCVSRNELVKVECLHRAHTDWIADSGAFSELKDHGYFRSTPKQYADLTIRWVAEIGRLVWASIQDWMCEPFILAKTGLDVLEHQRRSIESYWTLTELAPDVPWMPVLQGWKSWDYVEHLRMWRASGYAGKAFGLGRVCRRQSTTEIDVIVDELLAEDASLEMHGFGVKTEGLQLVGNKLKTADSMAWSLDARHSDPLPECSHISCANCDRYALKWRERMLAKVAAGIGRKGGQGNLFYGCTEASA